MSGTPFLAVRSVLARLLPASRTALLTAALTALLPAAVARAQVCGDASGDGSVTVSDGVQTLRAAAGLSSTCALATCDVDGNGSITVTDGVNVLRKAADLTAPDQCDGGSPDAEVAAVTDAVAPLLIFGFTSVAELGAQASRAQDTVEAAGGFPVDVDDCPDGGQRATRTVSQCITNVDFEACRYTAPLLGSFEFGGGLSVNICQAQVLLAVEVTDRDSGSLVNFDGFFTFTQPNGSGFVADGGPITIDTPQGAFDLSFQQLVFNDEGQPTSGAGSMTDTDDNFDLASIALTVTGAPNASLVATFDDGHQSSFVLNLVTGALTPA